VAQQHANVMAGVEPNEGLITLEQLLAGAGGYLERNGYFFHTAIPVTDDTLVVKVGRTANSKVWYLAALKITGIGQGYDWIGRVRRRNRYGSRVFHVDFWPGNISINGTFETEEEANNFLINQVKEYA
ncbi:MAG: hypothetical protein ACTHJR_06410, partial [Sphingomonas sp.]|uniref:hypothetical protein n=1 Tax=Sphingomonas sp. TaxID=28214 RepID=UPI003F7F39B5